MDKWSVGHIAKKRAMWTGNRVAYIYEDKKCTYREMNERANRVANFLKQKGLRKGDRVAVMLYNTPELIDVFWACAKLGFIFCPVSNRLVERELEYILNNCGARAFFFHDQFLKSFEPVRSTVKTVEADKVVFVLSGELQSPVCPEWAVNCESIASNYSINEPIPDGPVDLRDPLCIMYTSGTTGDPKGAVLTHLQTYFKNMQIQAYFDMNSKDVFMSQMPMFHSAGLYIMALPSMFCGGAFLIRRKFDPFKWAQDIETYQVTQIFALTTMLRQVLEKNALGGIDTSSVRHFFGGGEKTEKEIVDEMAKYGLRLQGSLGQTENSFMLVLPQRDIPRKPGSIGIPGMYTECWVADKEGNELPPNEVGELVASGPAVMDGYWNMPEATAKTIVNDVLHTGDLCFRDEEGYFYIKDREKDVYRSGGENVYPAEAEKILCTHPGVVNVAIIGVPDKKWGEVGRAFVVCKEDCKPTKEELFDYLKNKIAKFKIPQYIDFIDELPTTASGKTKKSDLKEKYGVKLYDKDVK
jgi:fatty-acyl-CoA synthase